MKNSKKIYFKNIDKSNYWDCICLSVKKGQEHFVSDNARSLVEANFEDGLNTLAIYQDEIMVGFILYDFDDEIPGWSMSRFMIDKKYQGQGIGKKAIEEFINYFSEKTKADRLFISVSLDNLVARSMYKDFEFVELYEIEYAIRDMVFKEIRMVKYL